MWQLETLRNDSNDDSHHEEEYKPFNDEEEYKPFAAHQAAKVKESDVGGASGEACLGVEAAGGACVMEAEEGACAPHHHPAAGVPQDPAASAPYLSDLEGTLEGSQMALLCVLPIFSASAPASAPSPSQVRASLESSVVGGGGGGDARAHEVSAVSQSAASLSQTAVRAPCIRVCLHSSHTYTLFQVGLLRSLLKYPYYVLHTRVCLLEYDGR
jgi:hypothetical protein